MTASELAALQRAVDHFGGNVTQFAIAVGASASAINFWLRGQGKGQLKPALCEAIERATNGAIRKQELLTYPWADDD